MAITINNLRINPYTQKNVIKPVFGDTMSLTFTLPEPYITGDGYILGLDYERVLIPTAREICALTEEFSISGNNITFNLLISTARFRDWVSSIKKPMPIWLQIQRVRGGIYETILLDDVLALPSVIDGANTVCHGDPLEDLLDKKLDKPTESGAVGNVLKLGADGQTVWGSNVVESVTWNDIADKPDFAEVASTGDYSDLSNKPVIPIVNNATVTFVQGETTKGTITLNQSANATITLDEGGSESVTWDDIQSKPTFAEVATTGDYNDLSNTPTLATVALTGDYNDLTNKPTIPVVNNGVLTITQNGTSKGTFGANQSGNSTINLDGENNIIESITFNGTSATITNKTAAITATIPTVGSGTLTINQNGTSKGSFNANATGNTSINLAGENNIIEAITFNGSSATITNKTAAITATIPTVNDAVVTITQGGTSKGSFTLNQASSTTIALDAGGGGSTAKPFSAVTSATLTADGTTDYLWGLDGTSATFGVATTSDSWQCNLDINLVSSASVTFSGVELRGTLFNNCLNRCVVVCNPQIKAVYPYDIQSAIAMTATYYAEWTLKGQDATTWALAEGVYEYNSEGNYYHNVTHTGFKIEIAGTNWRLLTNTGEYWEELAMGPEADASAFGTYGTVDYGIAVGDSIITFSRRGGFGN